MLISVLNKFYLNTIEFTAKIRTTSFILLCTILTLILYFPEFHIFKNDGKGAFLAYDQQIDKPLNDSSYQCTDYTAFNSHLDKTKFRLTIPILARILHLHSYSMIILQFFLLPLFIYTFYASIMRLIPDKPAARLLTLAGIFYYPFESFNYMMPFYDPYAYFFITCILIIKNPVLKTIILLLACFIDERAILGTGVILLTEYLLTYNHIRMNKLLKPTFTALPYIIAWGIYFGFRFYMIYFHNYNIPLDNTYGNPNLFVIAENYSIMPLGVLGSLEGYWILIIAGIILLHHQKRYNELFIITMVLLIFILTSLMVYDITRTFAYMFPLIFLFIGILIQTEKTETIQKLSLIVLFLNIMIPTCIIWGGKNATIHWLSPIIPKVFNFF